GHGKTLPRGKSRWISRRPADSSKAQRLTSQGGSSPRAARNSSFSFIRGASPGGPAHHNVGPSDFGPHPTAIGSPIWQASAPQPCVDRSGFQNQNENRSIKGKPRP